MNSTFQYRQSILARAKERINRDYTIVRKAEGGYHASRKFNAKRVLAKADALRRKDSGIMAQVDLFTGKPVQEVKPPQQLSLFTASGEVPREYKPAFAHFNTGGGQWCMRR